MGLSKSSSSVCTLGETPRLSPRGNLGNRRLQGLCLHAQIADTESNLSGTSLADERLEWIEKKKKKGAK